MSPTEILLLLRGGLLWFLLTLLAAFLLIHSFIIISTVLIVDILVIRVPTQAAVLESEALVIILVKELPLNLFEVGICHKLLS